jgi:hypothetical protein
VTEILNLLDKDTHTAIELEENYAYLIEKWGEWEIIGENKAGLVLRYVDIGNALFSGLMVLYTTLTLSTLCAAIIFGKIVFPALSKTYKNNNEEMVDLATLKSASQIDAIVGKKEWF